MSRPGKRQNATPKGSRLRLQVILARAGLGSRRGCEQLIAEGRVAVNGRIVERPGTTADPAADFIKVDGRPLKLPRRNEYLLLHKPVACVTTMRDPEGRFSVGDMLSAMERRLFPVGRLDYHSSGLLVLTDDGQLAERLTHPRYHLAKTYVAKVSRKPGTGAIRQLRQGVELSDGRTAPATVVVRGGAGGKAWVEITIAEGRNQQVRRMFEAVGVRVEKLRRAAIGPLELGKLPTGAMRRMEAAELLALKQAVGL